MRHRGEKKCRSKKDPPRHTLWSNLGVMKKDQPNRSLGKRASSLRTMLEVVGELSPSDRAREVLLHRAHGVIDRFEQVGDTMQKVADLQLEVMERLRPIVDDLGELVKLSLQEARQRMDVDPASSIQLIEHPPIDAAVSPSSTTSQVRLPSAM